MAEANRLPSLNLSSFLGTAAASTSDLFSDVARTWGVGASVMGPLFDFGRSQSGVESAEALARNDEMAGADRLWATDAGENAAQLMRDFMEEADALPPVSLHDFTRAVLETARSRLVRPRYGAHPRLQILGPLEARLAEADRVILAGLNEGVWPAAPKSDPFLSRGMRIAAGLSAPEERFGLAAHDFAQLACARDVTLTRSAKVDGAPTVASRWLWRLRS